MDSLPYTIERLREQEKSLEDRKAEIEFELQRVQGKLNQVLSSLSKNRREQNILEGVCRENGIHVKDQAATSCKPRIVCHNCGKVVDSKDSHIHDGAFGEYYTCGRR